MRPTRSPAGGPWRRTTKHRFTPADRTPVVGDNRPVRPRGSGPARPVPWDRGRPRPDLPEQFGFDLEPERLWQQIEAVDQFETWWPWLTEFRLEGAGLSAGSVLSGTVSPPLPYRMRIHVRLEGCERPTAIDAAVDGDLVGDAHLRFRPQDGGTSVEASVEVEMRQPAMRLASRVGRPFLQWGHDRVVETTVAGFRRRIGVEPV